MILFCFGTRPEWLKIKPIVNLLNKDEYSLLFTGQHEDLLKDVDFDYSIKISDGDNRLDQVISSCLLQFPTNHFDSILVQGDTASAFACALAAFNRSIRIIYLEAGLRSYNLKHPYPEEAYRQMIARISDVNLCPTELSKNNLDSEKVSGLNYVVGNTVLDNLLQYKSKCEYQNIVLVTLHRRENHEILDLWFKEINQLASDNPDLKFILPIHPNPNVTKHRHNLKNIEVVNPMNHEDLLNLLCKCKLVISDSGGIQEEGSFLNKKVIVCRQTTERPEGIETGHLELCEDPSYLKNIFYKVKNDFYIQTDCPYGDGHSSEKIIQIIRDGK